MAKMSAIMRLEAIETASPGNARLEAISAQDCPEMRNIYRLTMSPDITFGVKKFPLPTACHYDNLNDREWYDKLTRILERLAARISTGNQAQSDITWFLSQCSALQQVWAERIIKQDLRLNIGAKDVNKALDFDLIKLFQVPLAVDWAKCSAKDLKGNWVYEPKLDGGRAVAVLPKGGGTVKMLSRTGKVWGNFEAIRETLQTYNNCREGNYTLYLDGEVVCKVDGKINFQAVQKILMAPDGRPYEGELHYYIFDAATEVEWQDPKIFYKQRLITATYHAKKITMGTARVHPIPHGFITDPQKEEFEIINVGYVEEGYEGAMLRRADAPVKNKRSKDLLKVKLFKDDEAIVYGFVEGTGKLLGTLGALKCETKAGVSFEIGTGLDDAERHRLWASKGVLRGSLVSYKYQELTDDGVPRFPVYRGLRHSEDVS